MFPVRQSRWGVWREGSDLLCRPERVAALVESEEQRKRAAGESDDALDQKVLRDFFDGERLREIPAQRKKRWVILRWLAEQFEPDRRYTEREVNEIIKRFHPDYATLRRLLVDYRFMDRQRGVYWRLPADARIEV